MSRPPRLCHVCSNPAVYRLCKNCADRAIDPSFRAAKHRAFTRYLQRARVWQGLNEQFKSIPTYTNPTRDPKDNYDSL